MCSAESPEDLHHPSLGTVQKLHLGRTGFWLHALLRLHLDCIACLLSRFCKLAPARSRSYSLSLRNNLPATPIAH